VWSDGPQVLAVGFNKMADDSIAQFVQARPSVLLHNDGYNYLPYEEI
jgi:hypothetical protein